MCMSSSVVCGCQLDARLHVIDRHGFFFFFVCVRAHVTQARKRDYLVLDELLQIQPYVCGVALA